MQVLAQLFARTYAQLDTVVVSDFANGGSFGVNTI